MGTLLLNVDEELLVVEEALTRLLTRKRLLEDARLKLRLGWNEVIVQAEIDVAEAKVHANHP